MVDSGSTDATVALARATGATVVEHAWRGFAAQRNVALDRASGDWILEIDADERVTPALRDEILGVPRRPGRRGPVRAAAARAVPRRVARPGGQVPELPPAPVPPRRLPPRRGAASSTRGWSPRSGAAAGRRARAPAGRRLGRGAARHVAVRAAGCRRRPRSAARSPTPARSSHARRRSSRYRLVVDGGWRDGLAGLVRIGARLPLRRARDRRAGCSAARPRRLPGRPTGTEHFGRDGGRPGRCGSSPSPPASVTASAALAWLEAARAAGADVALITDATAGGARAIRARRLRRLGVCT